VLGRQPAIEPHFTAIDGPYESLAISLYDAVSGTKVAMTGDVLGNSFICATFIRDTNSMVGKYGEIMYLLSMTARDAINASHSISLG
jgi:hypothetical protein